MKTLWVILKMCRIKIYIISFFLLFLTEYIIPQIVFTIFLLYIIIVS